MSRFILILSFVALTFLFVCSMIAPGSPAIWLASTLPAYQAVRLLLMVILLGLIVSDPPRFLWFRVVTGAVATVMTLWALSATYQNHMQLLDGASILIASIAMAIEALEFRPEPSDEIPLKHAKNFHTTVV